MGAAATDPDFEPFHRMLTTASGISLQEQVKWADFRDDARRQGLDLTHCPGWQLPGEVFIWFKGLMLLRWPPRWWGNCHAAGLAPGGNPSFEGDRRRFDALASFYGNRYRGSVVINYLLGALAVLFALGPAAFPSCLSGRLGVLLLHALEIVCIGLIVVIYWRGRSPGPHAGGQIPVDPGRLRNHRWHERWLEYRGLAERFRYAELLYPLEAEVVKSLAEGDPHDRHDSRGWAQRYFEWRFGQAQWPSRDAGMDEPQRYVARLRQIMHEQKTYHEGNAAECETITRRLHWLSGFCFAGTLVATLVACALAIWWKDVHWHWLLLLAAGLPALAACVHGILATGEYIKLGESSTTTAGAIGRLMDDVDARPAEGSGRAEPVKSLEPLVPEVRAFWNLVTSEATGWQATLRDKNVPLP
jgi:hypothetical protein